MPDVHFYNQFIVAIAFNIPVTAVIPSLKDILPTLQVVRDLPPNHSELNIEPMEIGWTATDISEIISFRSWLD